MPVSSVWRWSHRHKARASFCMLIKEAYTKANCVKIYQQGFKNHLFDEDGHICQVFGDCGTGRSKGLKNKPDIWLTSKWCAHCNDWWWFGCRITWRLKWQNKWKFIHVVNESQWERKDFSDEQCKKSGSNAAQLKELKTICDWMHSQDHHQTSNLHIPNPSLYNLF